MYFYEEPTGENIRVDSGIKGASVIQSFYDPMISKLVVWGEDREAAREKSISALNGYIIHGVKTNITYLTELLRHKAYIENKITTKYCDEHTDDIIDLIAKNRNTVPKQNIAISYLIYSLNEDLLYSDESESIWDEIGYWRDFMEVTVKIDGDDYLVKINNSKDGIYEFEINNQKISATLETMELGKLELIINDEVKAVSISNDEKGNAFVSCDGHIFQVNRKDILIEEDVFSNVGADGKDDAEIVSPMPGKVIKINVKEGDEVKKGNVLLIVEAMKMENNIVSPKDAVVEKVNVKAGDMVDGSLELVVLG
jgi:acetyl/propionyl-CoA carboxylase alpha subunit